MKKNLGFIPAPEPGAGFTLVEIMVVIAIMALLAVAFFVNFKSFGDAANLKNYASDIQSLIRLAQSNATAGVKCGNLAAVKWQVSIIDSWNMDLRCQDTNSSWQNGIRKLTFKDPIFIDSFQGLTANTPCATGFTAKTTGAALVGLYFASLQSGANFFGSSGTTCPDGSDSVMVTLKNDKTADTKTVTISKGGSLDVK